MSIIKVKEQDLALVIRYSDLKGIKFIDKHLDEIDKYSFVWFGKIGAKPNSKVIKKLDDSKSKFLILNSIKECYFCTYSEVCYTIPEDSQGVPKYYYENFLDKGITFSILFKITSMIQMDKKNLDNFVVSSSANSLSNALKYSMSAHFLVRCIKPIEINN